MIREFADGEALAAGLAKHFAGIVGRRLQRDGTAAIALSGGATPVRFLRALSDQALDWASVTVTLVDDRWVPPDSPRSNAGLLRRHLFQGPAAAARFLPLVDGAATPQQGRKAIEAALRALALPFAAITLGMGTDGHTASFFPGGDRLAQALHPADGRWVETMQAPAAIEPRITLTLPALLAADAIILHLEGPEKRDTLATALRPGPVEEMPVRAILRAQPPPEIFCCP